MKINQNAMEMVMMQNFCKCWGKLQILIDDKWLLNGLILITFIFIIRVDYQIY